MGRYYTLPIRGASAKSSAAPPIRNVDARVVAADRPTPQCRRLVLRVGEAFRTRPGQFVHVLCSEETTPLLRRPFSVYAERPAGRGADLEILFTVVGVGTERLARARPGETVRILGPLGTWFTDPGDGRLAVFVAGGVGIVPFRMFAEDLRRRDPRRRIVLLFGGRSADFLHDAPRWDALGVEWHAATDDGSRGFRGLVTDLLRSKRKAWRGERVRVYTCGPDAMMRETIRICRAGRIPCQASLERRMGCALGACGACVTEVRDGDDWRYSRICFEGPVYDADRLVLETPAIGAP